MKLENVSYHYKNGDHAALNEVSCSFAGGELCAVVGPSGSGKTTLLSILAGLDRPAAGKVFLDGSDLAALDLNRYRRERVAMIFQAFHLFPLLTVLENVCFPLELNGMPKTKAKAGAKELLAAVDITQEKYKRFPANLSGGEQQRVAIARALSTGAHVLLADEPTGNLDSENSRNIVRILKSLAHDKAYCVIIVTHDMAVAEASDRVYRMADGALTAN